MTASIHNVHEATQKTIKFFESFLLASPDGIVITDESRTIILANDLFSSFFGQDRRDMLETNMLVWLAALDAGSSARWVELEGRLVRERVCRDFHFQKTAGDGVRSFAVDASLMSGLGLPGSWVMVCFWRDITDWKRAEEELKAYRENLERMVEERTSELKAANEKLQKTIVEKEALLSEVHHRVKNNMQIISSLLNMQSRAMSDGKLKGIFEESRSRIKSMALVHEKLYASGDFARIDFKEYIKSISSDLFIYYPGIHGRVAFRLEVEEGISMGVDAAIPCGLLLNELFDNAVKHAFPGGRAGEIKVAMRKVPDSNKYELMVADNGAGFQGGEGDEGNGGLGLKLINTLVEQLHGEMEVRRGNGTECRITFEERIRREI